MSFFDEVYEVVKAIPKGKVATYGQIASLLNAPRASRAVGYALHANPLPGVVPCHRVVNRFGQLAPAFAFGGREVQAIAILQSILPSISGQKSYEKTDRIRCCI